ncbi:xenotropic and polytropic retrovirus receptor 1 homolog isoform X1 [Zootermopsis nevadensis]|uniref:Xenotropic and polytropic retrovirus receptor 1-like protein n=1 Tax=Zootermopsis nevadensis TaxID=136037 RepID=A0A067QY66_ZOONE|nr:xenotropic and polytropic retrovirus receptor 1 homolog isoform X1 [Zootermopsis nevadensis]KDR11153.1 Xenotropic and polytropic retrovirus receptor 1-like protein [Zootermopsis nevadensis]
MKFAEHLSAHITPEWRKQYINYEEMKAMLYAAVEQAPSAELIEPEVLTRYFAKFDEQFFHYCDRELAKINTFYSEKLAEATRKFANLSSELSEAQDEEFHGKEGLLRHGPNILRKRDVPARKIQELKLAFSEFYLSLILLQNYQTLNFTGFRKILKKHDKLLNVDVGARWRTENVESSHFNTSKDIDRLIRETESTVTQDLEGGDRQRAMKRLRVPPLGEQQSPWTTFKVGLFSGSFIVLLIAVVLSGIFHRSRDDWRIVFRLYRGPLLIVEFLFLMGINVYGWRSSGVNHVLIFELDPRNHLSEQHIMELASIFGVVWALSVLSFLYSASLSIPPYVNPLALITIMAAFILNPTKTFRHEARFWALKVLGRIVLAPLFYVNFADFWLADQLNSLVIVLVDFQYFICFYLANDNWMVANDINVCDDYTHIIRPLVGCLPAWWRFAQCLRRYRDTKEAFPHLVNAGKYATSFFVMLFSTLNLTHGDKYQVTSENPYFYMLVMASVLSSCYAYTWDIKMDWGLLDKKAGDNKYLREEIVYSSTGYYYFAIVEDFILRFGWAVNLSLTSMGYVHGDIMICILSPLEVFRRFVWNFFRLENEHLNNCGKFRAVRDISVAPMDTSDQIQIIRMMDDEDGVINRRKKKHGLAKKKEDQRLLLEGESTDDPDS